MKQKLIEKGSHLQKPKESWKYWRKKKKAN